MKMGVQLTPQRNEEMDILSKLGCSVMHRLGTQAKKKELLRDVGRLHFPHIERGLYRAGLGAKVLDTYDFNISFKWT